MNYEVLLLCYLIVNSGIVRKNWKCGNWIK